GGRWFFCQAEDGIRAPRVTGVQTCALPICDVGGLAVDCRQDGTGLRIEAEVRVGVADRGDGPAHDVRDVDVGRRGDFARHDGHSGRDQGFTGDPRRRILEQDGVQDRVGDLIRDFVRMAFRDRLGSEDVAMSWHVLAPYSFKLPERRPAGNRASGSSSEVSTTSASANRKMSSASSAERAASAASAADRACAVLTWRISHLMSGTFGGAMDSVSYPSPSNRND